ncbi:MAG: 1,4-alpha-glucan branching protein GlgB [Gammaproteobacteria bacterium]
MIQAPPQSPDLNRLLNAAHHDPFAVLGAHPDGDGRARVTVYIPQARTVRVLDNDGALQPQGSPGLFSATFDSEEIPPRYRLDVEFDDGNRWQGFDPYCFGPQLGELDLHLFGESRHWRLWTMFGAHPHEADGVAGVRFAVWAPNAERVSVVGGFNGWDGRRHPMRSRGGSGVWELFIPGLADGELYKYEIRGRDGVVRVKTDPLGQAFELRPGVAARVPAPSTHEWTDGDWLRQRKESTWLKEPMSIYEVHLGSWRRNESGGFLNYRAVGEQLVAYVRDMGFTHIELLPVTEHPLDASWGYQTTGYFAPTSRFGNPDDLRWLIDHAHENGIGVLLDWAPGHFPKDDTALARFDGTAVYEHEDPRKGEHRDWGTYIFNYGRNEVRNFLIASALYWLHEFHIDGLRVDAVASMLYLDYSREAGDWEPNIHGGRENLEAIEFIKQLNTEVHAQHPGAVVIAEESTAWPQVTRPTWLGGLGFSMKWNMGWMHDSLDYMGKDPIYRHYHHDRLTFGLLYAFTENFVLPFSHDEVVHGKGSLLARMPGDPWQQFANLRLLYTYMWTYPGKKLLFMGSEFAQGPEWNHDKALEWDQLDIDMHAGIRTLIRDLNRLYTHTPALHAHDFDDSGFHWIDCHDSAQSVVSFARRDADQAAVVILNFTPVPRQGYRIGLPSGGRWREAINSDSRFYCGSDMGNLAELYAEDVPWMDQPHSVVLTLPPLAAVVLVPN